MKDFTWAAVTSVPCIRGRGLEVLGKAGTANVSFHLIMDGKTDLNSPDMGTASGENSDSGLWILVNRH